MGGLLPEVELNSFLVQTQTIPDGPDENSPEIVDLARDITVIQSELMNYMVTTDRLRRMYAMEFEDPGNSSQVFTCDKFLSSLIQRVFGTNSSSLLERSAEQQEW